MASSFVTQRIKVKNKKALIRIKKENEEWGVIITPKGNINFKKWSNWKLQGYWYDECIKVLKEIAKHITGYVEFFSEYCEENDFRIIFEDGKVFLQEAKIMWNDDKTEF